MARRNFRSLARPFAASEPALETADPPEPEELVRGGEAAAFSGAPVEVEEVEARTAASDAQGHPAPVEGKLVTGADVARVLGVSRQRVHQLRAEGQGPEPVVRLQRGALWDRDSVERWATTRSRVR